MLTKRFVVPIPDSVLNNSLELIIAVTLVRTQLWCVLQKGACLAEKTLLPKLNPDVELYPLGGRRIFP